MLCMGRCGAGVSINSFFLYKIETRVRKTAVIVCSVMSDMDEPSITLMGAHGYCTQVRLTTTENILSIY